MKRAQVSILLNAHGKEKNVKWRTEERQEVCTRRSPTPRQSTDVSKISRRTDVCLFTDSSDVCLQV